MLSPKTDRTPGRPLLLFGVFLAGVLLSTNLPARAEEVKTNTSLSLVPGDAAVFGTMLRNKEQLDLFYNSNAYKTLRSLPAVKDGLAMAMAQLGKEGGGPLQMYKQFMEDKDNQELLALLGDAASDELFVYMGKTWNDLLKAAIRVNEGQSLGTYRALLNNEDPTRGQARGALLALQEHVNLIKAPELVFGFKLKDTKKADDQLKRLEKLAGALEGIAPLKGKFKRTKIGEGDFLTLVLDAATLVPWDDVNLKNFEDKKDEFDDLIKHAKKQTLTISLGVQGKYLLLGFTSTTKEIEAIGGKGKSLAERSEFQPLAKHAAKKLTGISYVSKEFLNAAAGYQGNVENYAKLAKDALKKVDTLRDERRKAIEKDIDGLAAQLKKWYTYEYGASIGFSYMTDTGYEGWAYNYSNHDNLKGVKSKLHNYFGSDPIFAAAGAFKCDGTLYNETVSWSKKVYGHVEGALFDFIDQDMKDKYNEVTKVFFPILKRIDETTSKSLIPAMKDTGLGLVLDAKWSSKAWHKDMMLPKEMPMLELGVLLGISDAKMFAQALKEYRITINELIEKARGVQGGENIPDFKIPAAQSEKVTAGTLYWWPVPEEAGLDKQVQPVFAIGKDVSLLTFSKKHAERLLTPTPLKAKYAPLERLGDAIGVSVLNWPALIDAATPWVEFGVMAAPIPEGAKGQPGKAAILRQVKVGLEILKAFKGSASVSYLEDGKLVTQTQLVIKDIEKSTEP